MASPNDDTRRQNLSRRMEVRVAASELTDMKTYAAKAGVSLSALARAAILDAIEADRVPRSIAAAIDTDATASDSAAGPQTGALRELTTAVNKAGVNVNQVARRINSAGAPVIIELARNGELDAVLCELLFVMRAVQEQLGTREASSDTIRLQRTLQKLAEVMAENEQLRAAS